MDSIILAILIITLLEADHFVSKFLNGWYGGGGGGTFTFFSISGFIRSISITELLWVKTSRVAWILCTP